VPWIRTSIFRGIDDNLEKLRAPGCWIYSTIYRKALPLAQPATAAFLLLERTKRKQNGSPNVIQSLIVRGIALFMTTTIPYRLTRAKY
jgi:hypothetical protein